MTSKWADKIKQKTRLIISPTQYLWFCPVDFFLQITLSVRPFVLVESPAVPFCTTDHALHYSVNEFCWQDLAAAINDGLYDYEDELWDPSDNEDNWVRNNFTYEIFLCSLIPAYM